MPHAPGTNQAISGVKYAFMPEIFFGLREDPKNRVPLPNRPRSVGYNAKNSLESESLFALGNRGVCVLFERSFLCNSQKHSLEGLMTMRKTILAAACMCAVCGAWAAELGSLTVYSATGEPFRAQLLVKDVDAANKPQVRLSPASTYQMVGKEVVVSPAKLKLAVVNRNPYTVSITGTDAVLTSAFPLIVELSDGAKRSAKLYNIQLKPAAKTVAVRAPAPAVKTVAEDAPKTAAAVPSAQTEARAPVPAAVPSVAPAKKENTAVATTTASAASRAAEAAPKATAARTVQSSKPAAAPAAKTDAVSFSDTVRVQSGVTTWSTVKPYRALYPHASMDQIIVAFVRANPKAFEGGRVNSPKAGSTLRVPSLKRVESVGIDEAYALVRLAPNTDATKRPSAKLRERAANAIKTSSPALYRELIAQRKAHPAAAPVKHPKSEGAAPAPAAPVAPAAPSAAEKAEPPALPPTAAPDAEKAAPTRDPLADTIAATSPVESAPTAQPKVEEPAKPGPAVQSKVEEKPATQEDGGSGVGFWLSLLVLIAGAAGAAGWFGYRRLQRRREDAQVMKTVRFMKASAATDEQIEGVNRMMENRLEADKAAERGFEPLIDKTPEAAPAAPEPVREESMPKVETAPEKAAQPAPTEGFVLEPQSAPERREPTLAALQASQAPAEPIARAPHSGFSVASAYVDADQKRADEQAAQSDSTQNVDNKLVMARNYIGLGAKVQAARVLREVLAEGNDAQRQQAQELFARLGASMPGSQS